MTDIDVSDSSIPAAWKEVSEQKAEKNWILTQIDTASKPPRLSLVGCGSGGFNELVTHFDQKFVQFGVLRVIGKDNRETLEALRPKFVFFTFIGDNVSVLNRARVSTQRSYVEKLFNGYSTRLDVNGNLSNFTREEICKELLKCGGAHTPSHYVFGPGDEVEVANLK